MWAIGVDIGGTKIRAGAVSDAGLLAHVHELPTRAAEGPEAVLLQCEQVLHKVLSDVSRDTWPKDALCGVGVASAGRIDPVTGTVIFSTATFRDWAGTRIAPVLHERLSLPVFADNDVNAALLGEAWVGAAKGLARAAFVALGTGVGGALLEAGCVAQGATCSAGEFGHMLYMPDGHLCTCGARGCYEAYLAGPALTQSYLRASGQDLPSPAVMAAYRMGISTAITVVQAWVHALASLLYSIQNGFDPTCIVLGGGLIDSEQVWWQALQSALQQYPLAVCARPAVTASHAALYGAAKLAMNRYQEGDTRCCK